MRTSRRPRRSIFLSFLSLAFVTYAPTASAQWDQPPEGAAPPTVVAPEAPQAPGTPQQQAWPTDLVTQPAPAPPPERRVRFQGGISLGIPIVLNVDRDIVRPGVSLQFAAAADFGFVTLGARLGFAWIPIDLNNSVIPALRELGRSPLHRINFSPEIRLQYPKGRFLPYLASAFDANWWNFRETNVICDYWYCTEVAVYRFTPGYTGRLGLGIEVTSGLYIDAAFVWTFTGKGDFFEESRWALGPLIGVIFRM